MHPIEAVFALWSEIDLKMKMRRDYIIPISNQAIKIFEIMKPINGNSLFIFPTLNLPYNKPMNKETVNNALKRMRSKVKLVVAHGFINSLYSFK